MAPYCIRIPNEKAATYKVVTFIISLTNFSAFVFVMLRSGKPLTTFFSAGLLFSFASVFIFAIQHYIAGKQNLRPAIPLLISSLCWILAGVLLPGIALLIFSVFSLLTIKPLVIFFGEEGISYPSLPRKLILWKEVDFVILKDDILSIELKNNKLIQYTLDKDIADSLDAAAFNSYCSRLLVA